MSRAVRCLALLLPLSLTACAGLQQKPPPVSELDRLPPPVQPTLAGSGGGVFQTASAWSLTSDSRAFRIGDVVTVVLQETTQASKTAGTSFGKKSGVSIEPTVIAGERFKTDASVSADRDFSGNSSSSQQNRLQGSITVIVHEVLPNALLRVSGEKTLYLNQGEETVRLQGYVRASDISSDNSVSSQRIANARISYSGEGVLADANSPGWLLRFFVGALMPF
ncbi:MAG: flagellar basal body L-ring protein FlgH [Gammaproteobacteria bacterium]|jgi:flagellar L-ring protein FlgH|nr:flagellar basal body L-ring protein FlgH [Gammaproteobacteria bacterium]MBU0773469.1 flagellar basal body L-ring protein FlgH [Gammaproteobacteria bacterium]MBU0856679.1 flagellar basal body L-ring protein FlgH [Gammaproteobacteria bacterium]MBU1846791.1 flagellar basal body L-ring protein FlgH [Gammaproteobacteria bacterium]